MRPPSSGGRPHVCALLSVAWDGRLVFPEGRDWSGSLPRLFAVANEETDAVLVDVSEGSSAASFLEGSEASGAGLGVWKSAVHAFVSADGSLASAAGLGGDGAAWPGSAVVYSTQGMADELRERVKRWAVLRLSTGTVLAPRAVMGSLATEFGVRRLVCLGGGALFGALLEGGVLDELWLTFRPQIFGNKRGETMSGPPGGFLPASVKASLLAMEQQGGECFTRWKIKFGREFSERVDSSNFIA